MLTKREKEIVRLLTQAKGRKTIAADLGISIHTIDTHLRNIYVKTNTHSMLELFAWAVNHPSVRAGASLSQVN